MTSDRIGPLLRAGLMALAILVVTPPIFTPANDLAVQASPALDNDKKTKREGKNAGNSGDADHIFEGQVLSINRGVDPPEMTMGNVDGTLVIRVVKTDEIDQEGIRDGDYIRANGWKVHELLFEADDLELRKRYNPKSSAKAEKSDSTKKGKKKGSSSSSSNENESDSNDNDSESNDNDEDANDNDANENEANDNDEEDDA